MVGMGETFFPAFALAVGLGEVSAGLISSLPMLAGGILQLVSLRAVSWLGSEKRWVLVCAAVQGLAFVPLAIAAAIGSISLSVLLLLASVYWAAGLASGPAWNTWMQAVVPSRLRAKYFAARTRTSQLATLVAFLLAGVLLQWSRGAQLELAAFAGLFVISGLFRLASVACLASQQTGRAANASAEQRFASQQGAFLAADRGVAADSEESVAEGFSRMTVRGWRLLIYLVVMQGMVQISGPFFTPYLLEHLGYSYGQFVLLLGVAFAAKGIAFSLWATVAKRRGAGWLLWVGSLGIVPIAALWCLSQNFLWLVLAQVLSGTVWAAYELGFFLMFFETLPLARRTRMLTIYNFGNTVAWCLGAAVGALILSRMEATQQTYTILFAASSVGRLLAIVLLLRALPLSTKLRIPVRAISVRVLGMRPNSGGLDVPILSSIPKAPGTARDNHPAADDRGTVIDDQVGFSGEAEDSPKFADPAQSPVLSP